MGIHLSNDDETKSLISNRIPLLQLAIESTEDETKLKAGNLKLNGQLGAANSATFFVWYDDKFKTGKGAGPTVPPEATHIQRHEGPHPTAMKVEDSHIFSPNLFASVLWSQVNVCVPSVTVA